MDVHTHDILKDVQRAISEALGVDVSFVIDQDNPKTLGQIISKVADDFGVALYAQDGIIRARQTKRKNP